MLLSCTNKKETNKGIMTFSDFVDVENIEKVKMTNNSGTFHLNDQQVEQIKNDLSQMAYDPNMSVKVGAIGIALTIDSKTHLILSATHGDYIEVHKSIITKNKGSIGTSDWLYFKTNKVNFDNYKNENP